MTFPHFLQPDAMDCGPTCLRIIAKFYGKSYALQTLREKCYITREGVSLSGISDAAESIGFRTLGVKIDFESFISEVNYPCIVHWQQRHFVVVYKIENDEIFVSDPAFGHLKYSKSEFLKNWLSTREDQEDKGIALLLEPTPDFYNLTDQYIDKSGFRFLFSYLKPYKKFIVQLFLGLIVGSLLQLIFPFLTQSVVDVGISNQNINFIYLVLVAQLILFISRASVDFIRGWILLHLGTRINISLISDFITKLTKLPIRFFDTKMTGDVLQRINDNHRIESFLTSSSLSILFSMVNLIIFSIVLAIYSFKILTVFLVGSILYILWIWLFMKKRRVLDFKRFAQMSDNQNSIIQLISGMQEIKLNNCDKQKKWEWGHIQARLFKINIKGLALAQWQQTGSVCINELKNIIITFIAAKSVIDGNITLGMMLAIQYIIGQLNSPIEQMISFLQAAQDAKISLERLGEIHNKEDEEDSTYNKIAQLPEDKSISIQDVSFQYDGPHSEMVLNSVNFIIPEGKITAIVGMSGSGKTTLLKLLLGFYPPTKGNIKIGNTNIENYSAKMWRQNCGVVMQDGFVFYDTIAKNIGISEETVNKQKLLSAVKVANIQEFIESLPLGYNTKIGSDGQGLSQGQKQRILIARAVYKDPKYLFFDEATNALDSNNEQKIMANLENFFRGKTVLIIAHRLSTVKSAENIIVLGKGHIIEMGTHGDLIKKQGEYYQLVKNQLELGN